MNAYYLWHPLNWRVIGGAKRSVDCEEIMKLGWFECAAYPSLKGCSGNEQVPLVEEDGA